MVLLGLDSKLCDALLESIDETISVLLSPEVNDALYLHLWRVHMVSRNDTPYRLEILCSTLEKVLGRGSKIVCKLIARRLYAKLGLTFFDNPTLTLIDYVEEAKIKLGKG